MRITRGFSRVRFRLFSSGLIDQVSMFDRGGVMFKLLASHKMVKESFHFDASELDIISL